MRFKQLVRTAKPTAVSAAVAAQPIASAHRSRLACGTFRPLSADHTHAQFVVGAPSDDVRARCAVRVAGFRMRFEESRRDPGAYLRRSGGGIFLLSSVVDPVAISLAYVGKKPLWSLGQSVSSRHSTLYCAKCCRLGNLRRLTRASSRTTVMYE